MDNFQCLEAFADIVELGNFAKAAKKRFCSASAISKQINWLEHRLKIQLFIRSTRKLTVTDSGMEIYGLFKQFKIDFEKLQNKLRTTENEMMGNIFFTTPESLGEVEVSEWIHKFLLEYPQVNVSFERSNSFFDLIEKKVDIAIRTNPVENIKYVSEKLGNAVDFLILASPKYLNQYGTPQKPQDLTKHNCLIHLDRENPFLWKFKNNIKVFVKGNLQCNSVKNLRISAKNDLGIICLLPYTVQQELKSGELIEILKDYRDESTSYYLCYANQKPIPKRIEKFCEHLKENLLFLNEQRSQGN